MVQTIMKPLVYFDFEEYDGDKNLVLVSKERLKEILDEVYSAGYSDGNKNTSYITTTPYTFRNTDFTCIGKPETREITTGSPLPRGNIEITCGKRPIE